MPKQKQDLALYSWVVRGSQRREIVRFIDGKRIPAQIYQEASKRNPKITLNSVSDVLHAFREKGIAKCLNPEEKKGRVYVLTKKGKEIQKKIR